MIENLVNASLDIAKILIAAEDLPVPETYRLNTGIPSMELFKQNIEKRLAVQDSRPREER